MDYKERSELTNKLTAEDLLDILQMFINRGGDTKLRNAILKGCKQGVDEYDNRPILHDWHHTLQQCLMRGLIVPVIESLASVKYTDPRNEGTVNMCKEMRHCIHKYALPFI